MQFVSNFSVQKETIKKRKKPVIVRAFPSPPANPKGPQFGSFCKYQLLKYKPWRSRASDARKEDDNDMFCQIWNDFSQSELGHNLVPNWRRKFHNAELYFDRAEWMHLAYLCTYNDAGS